MYIKTVAIKMTKNSNFHKMNNQRKTNLYTGAQIPLLGFGTWRSDEGKAKIAVKSALEVGYRHIDCAYIYGNEREIGEAIKMAGIPREELFINSKLWNSYHHPDHVESALDRTLHDLQLDYLDSYIIHWPYPQPFEPFYTHGESNGTLRDISDTKEFTLESLKSFGFNEDGSEKKNKVEFSLNDTWRALENMVIKGKVKHIGMSNFNINHVKKILSSCTIRPATLQVELHPYLPQNELVNFCHQEKIHVTAYAPLGSYGKPRLLEDSTLLEISNKIKATPAQVLLSWAQQRGTSVIPKSSNSSHIVENSQYIALSEQDMHILSNLPTSKRFFDCYPVFY